MAFTNPFQGIFQSFRGRGQVFPVGAGLQTQQQVTARRTVGQPVPRGVQQFASPIGPQRFIGPQQAPRVATSVTSPVSGPGPVPTTQTTQTTQQAPTGLSELELRTQEVGAVFDPQEAFLRNLLSQIQGGQAGTLGTVAGRFEAQLPLLEQARTSALAGVEQRRGETRRREVTAIGEARRLASELQQRNVQQFGAGSAGQFAQEFQGRELQRGIGGIRQTTSANLQALGQQAQDIQANFEGQIQQLEAQKQSALQDARDKFQDRINQVRAQQGLLASEKTAAIADAARELRAEQFNIDQSDRQFRQGIISEFSQVAFELASQSQQGLIEAGKPIDLRQLQGVVLPQIQGFQQAFAEPEIQGQIRRREELT